jgi:hypothetical protein
MKRPSQDASDEHAQFRVPASAAHDELQLDPVADPAGSGPAGKTAVSRCSFDLLCVLAHEFIIETLRSKPQTKYVHRLHARSEGRRGSTTGHLQEAI